MTYDPSTYRKSETILNIKHYWENIGFTFSTQFTKHWL